jgi:transcriptional regulator with XRE-family HTH domain
MPTNSDTSGLDEAVLRRLGRRLARERLRLNRTQAVLAREAGVSRATVARLEAGESTQVVNLIRVLRALGLAGNVDTLIPSPAVSPLELAEREGRERQRASSPRTEEDGGDTTWTWGEDR